MAKMLVQARFQPVMAGILTGMEHLGMCTVLMPVPASDNIALHS